MITTQGKAVVSNFFGGQTPRIAGAVCIGVGTTSESVDDTALNFEVVRLPVTSTSADLANNRIIYKAVVPAGVASSIYEVGIYHQALSDSGKLLNVTNMGGWSGATVVTNNARARNATVQIDAPLGLNTFAWQTNVSYDLSAYAQTKLAIALTADAYTDSVTVVLGSDQSNYTSWNFSGLAAGYNVVRADWSAGVKVGSPDMSKVAAIGVNVTANSNGDSSVFLDGIRLDQNINGDELVARTVLRDAQGNLAPQQADPHLPTEIEYSVGVSVA